MLRMAIQQVNRLRPRFLLVSGDLTNAWPSEKTREIVSAQVSSFKEVGAHLPPYHPVALPLSPDPVGCNHTWQVLRELDPTIPLVLQPGNHDVGQNPTRDDVQRYKKLWGDDYFSFWVGGVLYIGINSQFYHIACANDEAEEMRAEQVTGLSPPAFSPHLRLHTSHLRLPARVHRRRG